LIRRIFIDDRSFFVIIEVNESGDILIPAELMQAPPHTGLEAGREGDSVVLKPLVEKPARGMRRANALSVLESRLADPAMTFRREDIYDAEGR
jgi:hypothetical protein